MRDELDRLTKLCTESILLEERFWRQVNKNGPNGCWEWIATPSEDYGRFRFKSKKVRAHRMSWIMCVGSIPTGMFVLHKCNNKKCVNPDHLYLGDRLDNIRDMVKLNPNWNKGESCSSARLTNEIVLKIRELAASGIMQKEIGVAFGVSRATVSQIVNRRRWSHI